MPILSGCGPVRLGRPAAYTPPPAGIDDLYRPELIARLESLAAGVRSMTAPAPLTELLPALGSALAAQREALLTGAQAEQESSASAEGGSSSGASSPAGVASPTPTGAQTSAGTGSAASDAGGGDAPPAAPTDAPSLVAALQETRDLAADACIQCSGSLVRVIGGIGAHLTWAAGRAVLLMNDPAVAIAEPPAAEALVPTRAVPRTDPPSVGAREDYQTYLTRTQSDEWYGGYAQEVMAARAPVGPERERHLSLAQAHRTRAEELGEAARADGLTPVAEEPVYPLPGAGADAAELQALPAQITAGLVVDWVSLIGAAPFERRALATSSALAAAARLSSLAATLAPLPSLEKKDG